MMMREKSLLLDEILQHSMKMFLLTLILMQMRETHEDDDEMQSYVKKDVEKDDDDVRKDLQEKSMEET